MQGFISGIVRLKNEDLIVQIIAQRHFLSLYRFYGLRHSIIAIGRKIDFEIEYCGQFMPKLRNIAQLGFAWENDFTRLYFWQRFLGLLNRHLSGTNEIDEFYFELLSAAAIALQRQSPKRVLIESYAKILAFEGRRALAGQNPPLCHLCQMPLDSQVALLRGFLPAHSFCGFFGTQTIALERFFGFLESARSIALSDSEVDFLLSVMLLGL